MSLIRDIQVSIPKLKNLDNQQGTTTLSPSNECSINIRANQDWSVAAEYRNNTLCAIRIQRNSNDEMKG
jgi:hypothetical protein